MKDSMQCVEEYFKDLRDIHQTGGGVREESFYGSLANLLNGIGKNLKPQVRCIIQLMNRGAGQPDGGLFTKEQWDHGNEQAPLLGQVPSRGVLEIKSTSDDAWVTADSGQVSKYWKKYQLVLVTNYRDFVLIGKDHGGKPVKLESFRLATDEADFWMKAAHPRQFAQQCGGTFVEDLRRTMLQAAPVSSPRDLAWFLASYARTANARIEGKEIPAMKSVRSALEAALGLKFEGDKGEHFFRSTLVQTIFYGIFSAWVLWSKKRSYTASDIFSWHDALWELKVPVMQALFGQIVTPAHMGPLELEDTLDWAAATLNRVDRASFFSAFEEGKAVQYFYEPFLEAFDPRLRKQLGVWYTPPEIVQYMVARVDTVLREELKVTDGLANTNVFVLDPCCGTGSYLAEVLRHIYQTLKAKGEDALLASDLKQAALKRVFGFEILPAPFVVSHMQLGLLLQNLGAPLSDTAHERAGVYLTNALTGWEPLEAEKEKAFQAMMFPELREEQTEARKVKQQVPILVILGNPPYNAFAGTATTKEEKDSVASYKEGLIKKWGIKKFNLDELYVRFFRMAEHRIAEQTGRGVVCLISNFSYLAEPSFVVMRQHIVNQFDSVWIDNMNGDSRETGKRTPDSKPDPSVFSTEYNKAGIRKGTAVITLVRKTERQNQTTAVYREFWGVNKRVGLLNSIKAPAFNSQYELLKPDGSDYFCLRRSQISIDYKSWPSLAELASQIYNGPIERRGNSLIQFPSDMNHFGLLEKYLDPEVEDALVASLEPRFMKSSGEFKASKTRAALKGHVTFDQATIVRYPFKPFDVRLAYLDPAIAPLFSRPSPQLLLQRTIHDNFFLITRDTADKDPEGPPFYFACLICDYDCISGHARHIPVFIHSISRARQKAPKEQDSFLTQVKEPPQTVAVNLSLSARSYLASLGISTPDAGVHTAGLIWMHALAIGYSPSYLSENADGIRKDWPHIPLPQKKELLEASAELGEKVAALLDTEKPMPGVTASPIRREIQIIATIARKDGGQLQAKELTLAAGWGHTGQNKVVMPGRGKVVERDYTAEERQSIVSGAEQTGVPPNEVLDLLGKRTSDIYLNDVAYWKNIPAKVWEYTIGGYQVIKKWLSYREVDLLGRSLTPDEAREVTNMARRIAAIILLQPALDENYQQCKKSGHHMLQRITTQHS
jgi:hypothetical protein